MVERDILFPIEKCYWCDSMHTEWNDDQEPITSGRLLDTSDIKNGIVYVYLRRYCKDCKSTYTLKMRFDVYSGLRMEE